jgi:hypothetical protein
VDLGEALFQQMAGVPSGGEPTGFHGSLRFLRDDYPSGRAMARDLGVAESTLRGWLGGRTPRSGVSGITEEASYRWRREALTEGREAAMRADWSADSLVVVGTYAYGGKDPRPGDEHREVQLGEYLHGGGGERLVDAFLDGASPDDLESILIDAIGDNGFYSDTFGDGDWDVDEVRWI